MSRSILWCAVCVFSSRNMAFKTHNCNLIPDTIKTRVSFINILQVSFLVGFLLTEQFYDHLF